MTRTPIVIRTVCAMACLATAAGRPLAAEPPKDKDQPGNVRIVLVGDSTVTDDSGWGAGFKARLGPGAECVNRARSGRSSKSYRDEGHWAKALADKPDYVLIQFGHNDQPGKGPERETDPKTTFRENLARYVDEARAAGAKPVLITSMTRRTFRGGHVARDGLADYAEAAQAVAAEKKVPVVNLYARSVAAVEALGPEAADTLGPAGMDGRPDRTHLNADGSRAMARLVVDELRKAEPALDPYLKPADGAKPER